jgi:hypothetical protein
MNAGTLKRCVEMSEADKPTITHGRYEQTQLQVPIEVTFTNQSIVKLERENREYKMDRSKFEEMLESGAIEKVEQ